MYEIYYLAIDIEHNCIFYLHQAHSVALTIGQAAAATRLWGINVCERSLLAGKEKLDMAGFLS